MSATYRTAGTWELTKLKLKGKVREDSHMT